MSIAIVLGSDRFNAAVGDTPIQPATSRAYLAGSLLSAAGASADDIHDSLQAAPGRFTSKVPHELVFHGLPAFQRRTKRTKATTAYGPNIAGVIVAIGKRVMLMLIPAAITEARFNLLPKSQNFTSRIDCATGNTRSASG